MSTQHQIMDSSFALGRLEINSPMVNMGTRLSGSVKEKNAQGGSQAAHLNGCVPLSHQVAGHKYGVDKVGILQHPDGTVLKQLQPPPRGPREMQFYSMVYAEDCCDPCLLDLQHHLPKYFGTWSSPESPNELYLKLEDVTRRFQKPCIMDVKIGQKSYDPFASYEKRDQQIKKYPLMEEIGFLVLGMRVYKVNSDGYDSYDQHYGRGLLKDTIKDGLSKFFCNGKSLRKDAITASILKVQNILRWFEGQIQLTFYASSLLFVYEGLPPPNPEGHVPRGLPEKTTSSADACCEPNEDVLEYNNNICAAVPLDYSLSTMYAMHKKGCTQGHHGNITATSNTTTDPNPTNPKEHNSTWKCPGLVSAEQPNGNGIKAQLEEEEQGVVGEVGQGEPHPEQRASEVEVRMIDFAHVFPSESQDQGYIYGLKHLLEVLQQILHQ
ncbi:inositol polyphosphate multikinase [Coregonus clupeaformis]|uniref:inositol polyphosphate multikinase n=1 Tax=Coregonus clupeaformis TaxID=59861 RepID=UPI001BDF89D6|nr:inositol polyphosphate multikinase [Coregonus clupeaformis]